MTISPFFSFWLKLRCLKMWKAALVLLPNKRSNSAWDSLLRENLLTVKKIPYSENWKIAQHSRDVLVASAATSSCAGVTHLPIMLLLKGLWPLWEPRTAKPLAGEGSLQEGLQTEQVTSLVWGKCQNIPGFTNEFKCKIETGITKVLIRG